MRVLYDNTKNNRAREIRTASTLAEKEITRFYSFHGGSSGSFVVMYQACNPRRRYRGKRTL